MTFDISSLTELLENVIETYIQLLTFGIDIAAGIVIGVSAIIALISFLKMLTKSNGEQLHEKEKIRLRLARGMLLALDFEVGSDILKIILVPGINEIAILAIIVGIRIGLSWSLSREIERHHKSEGSNINEHITRLKDNDQK